MNLKSQSFSLLLSASAISLFALATACGELPAPDLGSAHNTKNTGDSVDGSDQGQTNTLPAVPNAAKVDPVPVSYGYAHLPVQGSTAPYMTVFVEGGKAPVATEADANGKFCVDVPLSDSGDGTANALEVFVQDNYGQTADPSTLAVHYDPSIAVPVIQESVLQELAAGQAVRADQVPKQGLYDALTDGDTTTSVTVMASHIWFDLGRYYEVESLEVVFADSLGNGNDTFAVRYQVLLGGIDAPVEPPASDAYGWDLLYDISNGDGGSDMYDFATPYRVRYVALNMIENNKTDWLDSENITLSEIRIWGRNPATGLGELITPSCANRIKP